jgi:Bacterial Ig domain/Right handed beta helix region
MVRGAPPCVGPATSLGVGRKLGGQVELMGFLKRWKRSGSEILALSLAASLGGLSAGCTGTVGTPPPGGNSSPAVSLTVPMQGATVTGTITVAANASDNAGIAGVQFRLDGANLGAEVTVAPYSVTWSTTSVSNGSHTLAAIARDAAGNQATSAPISVTVNNSVSVSLTAPNQGATVSGSVTVSAKVSENAAVAGVQFKLGSSNLGTEVTSAPYSIPWDTGTASNGTQSLTAVARDPAGNRTTSSVFTVTVLNNPGTLVRVGPSQDWCGTINGAAPGTTVILAAGTYTLPCWISASGTASAPITIRSESSNPVQRAVMAYTGSASSVVDVAGSYLTLEWLGFNAAKAGVDAVRIRSGHDIAVVENSFTGIGGTSVVSNDADVQRIIVRGNVMTNLASTAMSFGCHDGAQCRATELLIEGNLVDGVSPADPSVAGYALDVELNSYGIVRDNTIYRTRGPGIIIYGSNCGDPPSTVEGNYVEGSQTGAGINISGGPAIVRNNIAVGNAHGGLWAPDYDGRGLQQDVWIVFNTLLNNKGAGIIVENWVAGHGNVLAYNAIAPLSGTNPLQPAAPSATTIGNTLCSPAPSCFDQPGFATYDLWPLSSSPLIGAAGSGSEAWRPADDFMGVPRGSATDAGALQRTGNGSGPAIGGGIPRPLRQP